MWSSGNSDQVSIGQTLPSELKLAFPGTFQGSLHFDRVHWHSGHYRLLSPKLSHRVIVLVCLQHVVLGPISLACIVMKVWNRDEVRHSWLLLWDWLLSICFNLFWRQAIQAKDVPAYHVLSEPTHGACFISWFETPVSLQKVLWKLDCYSSIHQVFLHLLYLLIICDCLPPDFFYLARSAVL